jgi:hypothetical protein
MIDRVTGDKPLPASTGKIFWSAQMAFRSLSRN